MSVIQKEFKKIKNPYEHIPQWKNLAGFCVVKAGKCDVYIPFTTKEEPYADKLKDFYQKYLDYIQMPDYEPQPPVA